MKADTKALAFSKYQDKRSSEESERVIKTFKFKYTRKYSCRYRDIYVLSNNEVIACSYEYSENYRSLDHMVSSMISRKSDIDVETLRELLNNHTGDFNKFIEFIL